MAIEKYFKVNLKYLPIKAHYFFLYGGTGCAVPYMQVFGKQFGISSLAIGIIFTLVPLCIWISKPALGFITDKFQDVRSIIIILILVTGLAFVSVLYVPSIRDRKIESTNITAACKEERDELVIYMPKYDSFCDKNVAQQKYDCELVSSECLRNVTLSGALNITESVMENENGTIAFLSKFHKNISNEECSCLEENASSLVCEPIFYACNSFSGRVLSEYKMYNFWIFVVLAIISGTGAATLYCLTDAACNEVLGDNIKDYGKQRLFGTMSWGIATLSSGVLNNIASRGSKYPDFSPGLYLMLSFFAIDILLLCMYPIKKARMSTNICKDVGKIFSAFKTVIFAVGVYFCGAFAGLLWTYQFWYLTDLGSKPLLLGLVTGVQCLAAEVPFFFFSSWFVKKIGHFYCLIAALIAYAIRTGLYSVLYNPWWVLPIELLHGVTFAVFFNAMTLFAIDHAPPGTEATMIGIFGGIFEGLGVASGSFLGGLGFNVKGGRFTFFVASMISLSSVLVLTIFNIFLSKSGTNLNFEKDKIDSTTESLKRNSRDTVR